MPAPADIGERGTRNGGTLLPFSVDPEDDPAYRDLACWAHQVGADAPLWFAAGYDSRDAAFLVALSDGDHRKPSRRELTLHARPAQPRPGPPGAPSTSAT